MRLDELFETVRLPLVKGVHRRARAHYGAFVCVMQPRDFLGLTTHETMLPIILDKAAKFSFEQYKSAPSDQTPFLDMEWDSGRIVGHEGRHRAAMIMNNGGDKFPCVIYPRQRLWMVTWKNSDQYCENQEMVTSETEALHREEELRADHANYNIRTVRWGTDKLRGHPERSETWDYSPWQVADFPPQLLGQFSDYSVPLSRIKVGLVKGYTHHTRP